MTKRMMVRVVMAMAVGVSTGRVLGQRRGEDPTLSKSGETLRAVFKTVIEKANQSTVAIRADVVSERPGGQGRRRSQQVALGTVITADGFILTKASEVVGQENVRVLAGGGSLEGKVVGISPPNDLVMLKVTLPANVKLTPVAWAEGEVKPDVGEWVATAGPAGWARQQGSTMNGEEPLAVGVVAVGRRKIPGTSGFLGVMLADAPTNGGALIQQVLPGSAAEKAKLKVNDVITSINGTEIHTHTDLIDAVHGFHPGDRVTLGIVHGDDKSADTVRTVLGTMTDGNPEEFSMEQMLGGPVSQRASDFSTVMEHDSVITPNQCGGPLVDLSGKVIGVNIARAGRTETYALPADVVKPLLDPLMSGKLAPVNSATPATTRAGDAATKPAHGE